MLCFYFCVFIQFHSSFIRSANIRTMSSRTKWRRLIGCSPSGGSGSGGLKTSLVPNASKLTSSPISMHKLCKMQHTVTIFWITSKRRKCIPECKIENRRFKSPYDRSTTFRVVICDLPIQFNSIHFNLIQKLRKKSRTFGRAVVQHSIVHLHGTVYTDILCSRNRRRQRLHNRRIRRAQIAAAPRSGQKCLNRALTRANVPPRS